VAGACPYHARMPWLLYRMMLLDLLRVIGLTAGVLVTVIAFGATIKPLTSDIALDATTTLKYLLLVIVPMLQFALPFAAGFGATIAVNRQTADNEIQAMAVSGLSYWRIAAPIAALGLGLLVLMVALTQEIIPRFWSLIEQMISADVTKVFQASIRRGEPFALGDMQIYADDIIVRDWPEGPEGPATRMRLVKVAAAELDEHGQIKTDVTARNAVVDVYRRGGATMLKLAMYDSVAYDAGRGDLMYHEMIAPRRAILIPGVLRDNPKAKSRSELLQLRGDPDRYGQVVEARQELVAALRDHEARNALDHDLGVNHKVDLLAPDVSGEGRRRVYTVRADGLMEGRFGTVDARRIEIIQSDDGQPIRRFVTDSATLVPASGADPSMPTFDLVLGRYEVTNLREGAGATGVNQRERNTIPALTIAEVSTEDLLALPSAELLARADKVPRNPDRIRQKRWRLQNEIDSLGREISARLLNRYALSVTAPLLLLLGSILAMWLRRALPLTIYVLAFLPAVVDLILISAGEQLMRDGRTLGPLVMWSGNALMLTIIAFAYAKVAKH